MVNTKKSNNIKVPTSIANKIIDAMFEFECSNNCVGDESWEKMVKKINSAMGFTEDD